MQINYDMPPNRNLGSKRGYNLVFPDQSRANEITGYFINSQKRTARENEAFVPSGVGMLITPDQRHFVFSIYHAGKGNVYDLDPLQGIKSNIATSDVRMCGVTTANFEGFKLLTHAG